MSYLSKMTQAYIECAMWSSTDESDESGGEPIDLNYGLEDIDPASRYEMDKACRAFYNYCIDNDIDIDRLSAEQVGHDFWLTRNGHGTGFWDRGLGELGEKLTRACKTFGESYMYIGDDGRVYIS